MYEAKQFSRRQLLTAAFSPRRDQIRSFPGSVGYTPISDFSRPPAPNIPKLNVDYWSLAIGGAVNHPLILSYNDLLAFPAVDLACTVACANDRFNIGHALWRGVPMQTLLDTITLRPEARFARLHAANGQATNITLEHLTRALVAFAVNGDTLPPEHGFPARLIVPGLYAHKMPRWIERIEIGDQFAQNQFSDGVVRPMSAITHPRHLQPVSGMITFAGYAYAGERAVAQVEVRIDGSDWMPVPFSQETSWAWARWQIDWSPPHPGDFAVQVRATDSNGTFQPSSPTNNINDSHCIHTVTIRVL